MRCGGGELKTFSLFVHFVSERMPRKEVVLSERDGLGWDERRGDGIVLV